MDYFGWIPNDIVNIILSFVDSIDDSLTLLLVCKRFHHLLRTNEGRWRSLCLEFWNDFKQQLTQQGGRDYCIEGQYNLERAQRESGKDWLWFSQCFANRRVFKSDWAIWIGPTPGKTVNGWGIKINRESATIGNFIENELNGDGTFRYNTGVKYEGEWDKDSFHGLGSIIYPDGIQYQGQWNMDKPGSMDCFYCDQ